MPDHAPRRRFLQYSSQAALLALPWIPLSRPACAAANAPLRAQLKYQDTPLNGQSCTSCLEFLPGKSPADRGGCKAIPGDDEISPEGWCTLWNTL